MTHLVQSLHISSLPYVNALVTIFLFIVAAKVADLLVDKVLRKFSRFTRTDLDDMIIDLTHKPVFYTILTAGCIVSLSVLAPPAKVLFYTDGILYSTLVAIWCITAISVSNIVVEHVFGGISGIATMHKDIVPLVKNVVKIVIIIATVTAIFSIWKINITPIMASAGIAGAAVAFAAKDTIANFFGGISVFVDKPFQIGDYIVLDKGERGEVVNIGLRSTRIKTRDDILITVPNSVIANTQIINESAPIPNFRIRLPVSVAYGSDIDLVQETLLKIAADNNDVIPEPAPRVRFRQFGDSSLNFELLCWTLEPALRGRTVHELNCSIYKKFNELGITIPFPQRDVHISQS